MELVLARAAVEHVVSLITIEDVIASKAVYHVVSAQATDHIGSGCALEHVPAARARDSASSPIGIRGLGEISHVNSHRGGVLGAMTISGRVGVPVAATVVFGRTVDEGAVHPEGQRAVFRLRYYLSP